MKMAMCKVTKSTFKVIENGGIGDDICYYHFYRQRGAKINLNTLTSVYNKKYCCKRSLHSLKVILDYNKKG